MLRPLDRDRRDGPLYPGSSRTLRDCIDPKHELVRIDATFDFAALAAELDACYNPQIGRPAIHPEMVLRALLLAGLYGVTAKRQLCERIRENLAWRWFCYLTLDDAVFDHSTLSVFLSRVQSEGLERVFATLNDALQEAGLLSRRTYLDSSLIAAHVRTQDLVRRDPDDAPPLPAGGEEDVFVARDVTPASEGEPAQITPHRYQDAKGKLPLPSHDRDCRWRTIRGRPLLGYADHVWADRSGFILASVSTAADVSDVAAALLLLEQLPLRPTSVAADTNYRAGRFRHALHQRDITPYIPIASTQDRTSEAFTDHFDHFTCSQGADLRPTSFPDDDLSVRYAAHAAECRPCPLRQTCVAPSRTAKVLWASRYRHTYPRAHRLNATTAYTREQRRRKTVAEGVFAQLDRLGGTRACYRGLERVSCHRLLTHMAHNIRKAMTKRRFAPRATPAQPRPARQQAHTSRDRLVRWLSPTLWRPPHPGLSPS